MTIPEALVLSLIIAAFVVFGVVLAWGQYQTRNVKSVQIGRDPSSNTVIQVTFDRTQGAADKSGTKQAA